MVKADSRSSTIVLLSRVLIRLRAEKESSLATLVTVIVKVQFESVGIIFDMLVDMSVDTVCHRKSLSSYNSCLCYITQRNHVEAHQVLIITITKLIFKLIVT